ncbi:S8 family serine peptidase [Cytobacillus oceanisediminis]|uniref:S8 family serine peptidase n=1 Tax=Cytobacillus oceanisediminis TaxID=665099 RepID=UPI001D15A486|nr:S8 family serine peptidase [Cytobacillus oceanisediminis]MCC3649377.1 S8 family serine peptidase [Cytobacillus oceanisediminis]
MRKKTEKKLLKSFTVLALTSGFILGSVGQATNNTIAASPSKAEDILAGLTSAQRAALNQLSTNEETGLQISSEINVNSSSPTSVIIEFANKPSKVARIEAEVEGKTLTESEAVKLVDQDHATFSNDVAEILTDKNSRKIEFKINRSYKHAFNGVSMTLPANQIKNLLKSKAVKTVWSNETFTIDPPAQENESEPKKADEYNMANYTPYDGLDRLHAKGFTGKGIKVGILDTGIDYNHPDLKDAYKGGYDFVDDDADPMETTYEDWKKSGKPEFNPSAYYTEHGTHVAGIVAGRGKADSEYKTLGAAPEADVYAYRVLGPYGSGQSDDIIAAVDRAVKDGMDVINMSLGSMINDPLYATSIAVNNAVLSGVTTVVSAGNSGDKMYTLGSPGTAALALTVGASSIAIDIYQYEGVHSGTNYSMRQLARNYQDDLSELKGKTYQLVDVGLGYSFQFTGKDVNGKIALIKRGSIALMDKIKNAKANGAAGVIMYNDEVNQAEGAIQAFLGESVDAVPAFSVSNEEGLAIIEAMKAGQTEFTFGDYTKLQTAADELAAFSSRGPSRINYDIKPEVTGPGVSILSTVPFYMNDKNGDGSKPEDYKYAYSRLSGTSMSAPYVAGVSALLLQSNKDLEPADVKAILMNTADPLSKDYSVFEVGSGRVDAYEAINSNVEIQVVDKTPTYMNGKEKSINELTGGMSFGSFGFDNQDISDSRKVTLKNRSEKAKTFNVDVKFQTGLIGSKDAAQNNVTLTGPATVKLKGISQKSIKFNLNIPKTAEKGTYEGYITFTNSADPTEQYQIPFGGRVVNEGIESFEALPLYSTDTAWPATAWPFLSFQFALKSHMKALDVILQDSTTGEDLGLVGSFTPITINEGITYYVSKGFTSMYYPFTGDSKNPISSIPEIAKTGHYKLKMVGTNEQGKTFTKTSDFIYELGKPTMTSSFDSLDQKVIEYNDSQFDSNGEFLYDFNINLHDPETEEAGRLGLPVDQSNNAVVTFYNSPWPKNPVFTDKDGNYTDKIVVRKQSAPLQVQFYGMDYARNVTGNAFNMLRVVFVDQNLPYYYLKPNKKTVTNGETVNFSVRSNNVKKLKTSKITIPVDSNIASIENVVVNDAVKHYGDAQMSVTTAPSGGNLNYTISFTYLGDKELPEDLQLFNFDLKTSKKFSDGLNGGSPFNWFTMTASTTDQSNAVTNNVYAYMESIKYKPTYSKVEGSVQVEGAKDSTGQPNFSVDLSKVDAKVTVTSYDGKTSVDGPIYNNQGQYIADGLKAEEKPYTLTVDVPGHFTMNKQLVLADEVRGELVGKRLVWNLPVAAAGDVNKDDVIDVLDALEVQNYWGTNEVTADFNFDKVVDEKDINYIVKNFGLQNPTVSKAPKAKKSYKGSTLDSILSQLGIK